MRHAIFKVAIFSMFVLSSVGGAQDLNAFSLEESLKQNSGVIIVFLGVKCPYSNAYNERLNGLFREVSAANKKIGFAAVYSNSNETATDIKKHFEERKFEFPIFRDEKQKTANFFGVEKTPEALLVSAEGKVVYRGRIDDDLDPKKISRRDLFEAFKEFTEGKKISQPKTKALGCGIKRG